MGTNMMRSFLALAALVALAAAIPSRIVSFQVETTAVTDAPCCETCAGSRGWPHAEPLNKYFSIADDSGPWLCGETCIRDSYYGIFHLFERNLTKAPGGNSDHFCADHGYTKYNSTVTHGGGGLDCTLDLYECTIPGGCVHP